MRAPITALSVAAFLAAFTVQSVLADAGSVSISVRQEAQSADQLLAQGLSQEAYFLAIGQIDLGNTGVENHIVAAKAAFAQAKNASLLRKKRWAKRGRDNYKAALAIEPNNRHALLGLATFALRAPSGLGGGEDAYQAYLERLRAVSADYAGWLEARAALEAKNTEAAFDAYESLIGQVNDEKLLVEYVGAAEAVKAESRAYAALNEAVGVHSCAHVLLGDLASQTQQPELQRLGHYLTFLRSGERYCNRQFVALETAQAALEITRSLSLNDQSAKLAALIESLEQQQRDANVARYIAS